MHYYESIGAISDLDNTGYAGWIADRLSRFHCWYDQTYIPTWLPGTLSAEIQVWSLSHHNWYSSNWPSCRRHNIFDSLSQQVVGVNEKAAVWLKMDQVKSTPASVGSFAIDTTIINVFDQHFRVVMRKGTPVNAYRYSFQRVKDSWELDMLYIARKSGSYTVSTSFHQILTGENTRCMLGNVSTYGGSTYFQSTNNQISQIYPIVTSHNNATNLFGFIVDNWWMS